ncbi:LysR family transcriptional regulator [Acuticoccus kandeliae]|uniref:LysR family transcriptional regulator n=1 Tax=Acuticoccus kandeliae TaxID=2073160 RepID=UPI001473CC5C|nr:LysR family transcriptional regulator [Acuticoccus kandeliae]
MNSETLLQFLAVYRHRGIGKASRQFGVSQPAISNAMRRLEDELKVTLFHRTPTGVEPTTYADILARRAEIISNELERAREELDSLRSFARGEVRFGVGPALAASLVSEALATFLQDHPQLTALMIEGLYEALTAGVESGRLDFAITTKPIVDPSDELTAEDLFRGEFLFVTRSDHPLAHTGDLTPTDLFDYPWVLPPSEGLLWQSAKRSFDQIGLTPPPPRVETNSGACIKALMRSGLYLSLVPPYLVMREVELGEMTILSVPEVEVPWSVVLLRRAGSATSPAAEAFLAHLKGVLAAYAPPILAGARETIG